MRNGTTPKQNTRNGLFRLIPPAALFAGLALALCWGLVFEYAPKESTLGLPQKIFYLHLPLAWWALTGFFLTFVAGAAYLCTGREHWDAAGAACAEVSLVFAFLAVISGSIWARASWGVWWTWDARLTTALIMCFVYAGYLILRRPDMPPARRARISAVLGIAAFLDVPLVFFSARLWSYIHPPSISLEPEMKMTLAACLVAFAPLWLCLTALRMKIDLDGRRLDALQAARLLREDRCRDKREVQL
ncbi:MAG: cytochrome c biogenesis protein [Desulfovibrio sp.]|nr:cytochrome c biogenesis protein [Desulfovibrio sp.]